jgi:DNA-binding NtrC family response regulator
MPEEIKADVLLVDDEEKFVSALSQRLQVRGLKVDTASSGEEALKRIKSQKFDAIILDLVMPGMSGVETLKHIKKEDPELQIIMLSGHGTVEKSVEAIKAGAVDFLEKPVDINKLIDKIGEARHKRILVITEKMKEKVRGRSRRL